MAHFAEIDADNVVLRVLVVPQDHAERGEAFLRDDMGLGGRWLSTSYNAGPGMRWDEGLGAFLLPQPFPSWTIDAAGDWQPPTPRPQGENWVWDEAALAWVEQAW